MINRLLIRLKVVQISYAYYQNGEMDLLDSEKELFKSLSNTYYLYNLMFLLMLDIKRVAEEGVEATRVRHSQLGLEGEVSTQFVDNKFLAQLETNFHLKEFAKQLRKKEEASIELRNFQWKDRDDLIHQLYASIIKSDIYNDYIKAGDFSYEADRKLWHKIYRSLLTNSEAIDEELESLSLYWNDDKAIVDSFVLKSIRQFEEANGEMQQLMPEYRNEEDKQYAANLFRNSIKNAETYRKLIEENNTNWEMSRMALMDIVILQTALTEIVTCTDIPVSVSINEYVEIAKTYSTPRSGGYVNALLDTISKQLKEENKLIGKRF